MTVFLQIYSRESRLPEPDLELQGKIFYVYQVNKYLLTTVIIICSSV